MISDLIWDSGFCFGYRATQEDELGELYLSNVDFLMNGVPASIIATLVSLFWFGLLILGLALMALNFQGGVNYWLRPDETGRVSLPLNSSPSSSLLTFSA